MSCKLAPMQAATFGVQDVSTGLMSEAKKEQVPAHGKGVQLALAPTLAVPDALPHKEKMGLVGVKGAPAPSPAASAGNNSMSGDAVLEACCPPSDVLFFSHSLQEGCCEVQLSMRLSWMVVPRAVTIFYEGKSFFSELSPPGACSGMLLDLAWAS